MNKCAIIWRAAIAALSVLTLTASSIVTIPALAGGLSGSAMSCDELWYQRNAIYAAKGYCFKSQRALSVFGPRCYPPYGKLTASEQAQVDYLRGLEQARGCGGETGGPVGPGPGSGYGQMTCDQLWYARNSIYAAKGYCFATQRARNVFGPGCFPPYGQLSPSEQSEVGVIQQWESAKGCR